MGGGWNINMQSIVFYGSSEFSVPVLRQLLDARCKILEVITTKDKPAGRHLKLAPNPLKKFALEKNLQVYDSLESSIHHLGSDTIGLVAAYGKIIPQSIIDEFAGRLYNIHPSLLPKYRGPSPLQQQILDNVTETGVTIIKLDAQMDHGPIVAVEKDTILPTDTWKTLGNRLFAKGTNLFISRIQDLGSSIFTPQNDADATYTRKLTRQDGYVAYDDFKSQISNPNTQFKNKLRAFDGWPGVWSLDPEGNRIKQ